MQKLIDAEKGGFTLGPADWNTMPRKFARLNTIWIFANKAYLELEHVLHDGVFFAANKLYGITFKERKDLPVYQPDVRVFEVFDANGKSLALFYADYFQRSTRTAERAGQLRRSEQLVGGAARCYQRHELYEATCRSICAAELRRCDDDVS